MNVRSLTLVTLGAFALTPAPARASDYLDTWVTFTAADAHIRAEAEDGWPKFGFYEYTQPLSFFDQVEPAYEPVPMTRANLVLYRHAPGYLSGLDTEAALISEYKVYHDPIDGRADQKLRERGSYVRLSKYDDDNTLSGDAWDLTLWPFDSERFVLGHSDYLQWGGRETWPSNSDLVPGFKLGRRSHQGDALLYDGFVGMKSARVLNEDVNEQETYYGWLGGVGADVQKSIRLDISGAYFQKGVLPPKGATDENGDFILAGVPIQAWGVTGRAAYHLGSPIARPVDFRLYKKDMFYLLEDMKAEQYESVNAVEIQSEITHLAQTLIDYDAPGSTTIQPAHAADLNIKVKRGLWRFHGDGVYRSLSFILFNVPSLSPFYDFPDGEAPCTSDDPDCVNGVKDVGDPGAVTTDELFFAVGAERQLPRINMTPGLAFGYQVPATYTGLSPATEDGSSTLVVRDAGDFEILPAGAQALDILSARASARWQLSDMMWFVGETKYTLDYNQTKYDKELGSNGTGVRVFDDPDVANRISITAMFQARF